ncbi:LamG domain-containing protein [Lysinibacillus sp. NPDC097279]|uniref:LamG domain-containing protein n=1 Tax=Lysinibacillus sp. NPDC097279 TaxID=3364143 RepID=UPI003815111E
MANSKDNLSKYGKTFISFDEINGNAMDSIGGYTCTIYNTPTRVTGWNGNGNAMSFNGTSQYAQFSSPTLPLGAISIRLKIKKDSKPTSTEINEGLVSNVYATAQRGVRSWVESNGTLCFAGCLGVDGSYNFRIFSTVDICDGKWHDILFTWDGTTQPNQAKIYVDNMLTPSATTTATVANSFVGADPLTIGRASDRAESFFKGELDSIEIYDRVISPIPDKYFVEHNSDYKYHDGTSWKLTTPTEENFIQYGMNNLNHISESQWKELSGNKSVIMWSDFEEKQFTSVVLNKESFKVQDLLGDTAQAIYYTDSDTTKIAVETGVEPYSVYDYIGEFPEILIYTESTDDIVVSTTTEPFDIYDEFGDSVEVLYYTDDTEVTNADLILEANYSPLDELEGDFEVVTWTDEAPETAQRVLEMQAIPKPQFIKLVNPKRIYGALDDVLVNDISQSYRDEARYFVSGTDTTKWYVWDSILKKFIIADASSEEAIIANGMKHTDLNNITDTEWRTWNEQHLNIGIFLKDNPRDTIVSVVENVSYEDYLPRHTAAIQDTSLYILNTTAKIDIAFNGNVLKGVLSDDDLTRVQYRVLLNNRNFYPSDGSFTKLGESPQNIELVIRSKDIKIDDWNTLKVEFKDYFGTTDYWSTNFMGTYSGLMFKDVYGEYFSNEIGDVLKYLDFGVIIAGQTTIEHEVILKNQYGYDVKNVHLYANTANFPTEMTVEFSQSQSPFIPHSDLKLSGVLANNAEMPFFIRLKTKLGSTPDANGSFDIIVRADKA